MPALIGTGTPTIDGGGPIEAPFTITIAGLNLPANSAIIITFIAKGSYPNDPVSEPGPATFSATGEIPPVTAVVNSSDWWGVGLSEVQVIAIAFPGGFTGDYVIDGIFENWSSCVPFDVVMDARYNVFENVDAASLAPENFRFEAAEHISEAATDLIFAMSWSGEYLEPTVDLEPQVFADPADNLAMQDSFYILQGPVVVVGEDRFSYVAATPATVSFTGAAETVFVDPLLGVSVRMWAPDSGKCVDLSWTASTAVEPIIGYRLYRSVNGGTEELIADLGPDVLTYHDQVDVGAGTSLQYRVEARTEALTAQSNTETVIIEE